jgi:hypothetical protein
MSQDHYEHHQRTQRAKFISFLCENLNLQAHEEPEDAYDMITFASQAACDEFFMWHNLTVDIS